jgi:hypothetical protein
MTVMLSSTPKGTSSAQLKVRLTTDAKAEPFVADALRITGVKKVEQTFPGDADAFLATLYVADVDPRHIARVIKALRADSRVEAVEKPAPRKLIRPR